jgi:SUKH-3 immunity protein
MSRFRPEVEAALREGGWFPGRSVGKDTMAAVHREIHRHQGRFGGTLDPSSPAELALDEFGGLSFGVSDPGGELNPRPFALDPTLAAPEVQTFIDFARALDTSVYPLGVEGLDEGLLCMDVFGQVFAIDATGEWYLGGSIDEALDTLLTGRQPARVDATGNWPGRVPEEERPADEIVPLGIAERPVGVAFFLPRTPSNIADVWLPDVLTRIGTVPREQDVAPHRLEVEWGGLDCEAHVLDLPDFTVLLLVFEHRDLIRQMIEAERLTDAPDALPLVGAFRQACFGLRSDLDVAFVLTRPVHRLDRRVAAQEYDVLIAATPDLIDAGFPLLYLSAAYANGVPPQLPGRDELPVPGGRLIFGGTGPARLS